MKLKQDYTNPDWRRACYLSVMTPEQWDQWLSYKADFLSYRYNGKTFYNSPISGNLCPVCRAFNVDDYHSRPCHKCIPGSIKGIPTCINCDDLERIDNLIVRLEACGVFD